MPTLKLNILKSPITISIFAMVLGMLTGAVWGKDAGALGLAAWLPLSVIKGLATPLLFLAIVSGLLDRQMTKHGVKHLFVVCVINAVAATTIAVLIVNLLEPGRALTAMVQGVMTVHPLPPSTKVTWYEAVRGLVPDSVFGPFVHNNVPAILVLAILVGFSIRHLGIGKQAQYGEVWLGKVQDGVQKLLHIVIGMMQIVLKLMPLAIFASVAKAVGENGLAVMGGLSSYVGVCIGGMLLQILLVYHAWIRLWAKRSLRDFWRHAELPVLHAFGVNSSLATLPNTLQALDDLKVSPSSARLGACVGTNFNNDGILLYEVATVLMLAQASGLDWSIAHQLMVAGMCVLAALGVSGFPEAGVIALTLVLGSAGLPLEILPLLLPVDWLVARMRSATNVTSDMTVSIALDRYAKDGLS